MILSSISRKYAAYLLLLLSLVVGAALAAAGYITLQGTTRLQRDLQHFIAADESARQKEALRATAVYLRSHLFNPLYNLDIEQLHREIAQVRAWLPVSAFLISDRAGRVLSDGAPDNRLYGATLTLPLAELDREPAIIRPATNGLELFLVIGHDQVVAGYAYVKLSNTELETVLQRLNSVSDQLWRDYWQALTRLALIAALAIVIVGGLLGLLLSRVLARPLVEMSKAAQAYAAGQLEQQLPVSSPDELGQLAQALNTLATDLRDSQIRLAQAQHIAQLGFWDWQPGCPYLRWSAEVYRLFGMQPGASAPTVDHMISCVKAPDRDQIRNCFTSPLDDASFHLECGLALPGGEERTVVFKGERTAGGEWVGTVQDITERKQAEDQLAYLANYDALTGLPNRYLFQDRLEHTLRQANRSGEQLALLFLDLDRFKAINDTFGHAVGDEMLKLAARRLLSAVRTSDTVARLGGDEFTLLLENVSDSEEVSSVAHKALDAMSQPFVLGGRELCVSVSIGIALYPGDAADTATLLKHADAAMYQAKEQGRAVYRFFTSELNQQAQERLRLETALRNALARDEFVLYFQPQVQIDNGRIIGFEALLRWRPNQADLVSPDQFIPVLEETGLIIPVGEWVLREACQWLQRWQQAGLWVPRVAVNLSARQFQQGALVQIIADILAATDLATDRLELEITESMLVEHALSDPAISQLQNMGVRLAIDDFGTGYCSLSYLKRFEVDTLKIDRSFVRDLGYDSDDAAITTAIITLAHSLELTVIAEGVETTEQIAFLQRHGCDYLQGFLASRPLPPEDCAVWLRRQTARDGALFWNGASAVE